MGFLEGYVEGRGSAFGGTWPRPLTMEDTRLLPFFPDQFHLATSACRAESRRFRRFFSGSVEEVAVSLVWHCRCFAPLV